VKRFGPTPWGVLENIGEDRVEPMFKQMLWEKSNSEGTEQESWRYSRGEGMACKGALSFFSY
jgi:hypothetical protein